MKSRGITLIEFVVSIALVAVVMVFLFNMLVDIQYNSKHGSYASDNQLNRASIVRTVMDDFTHLGLVGIQDNSTSSELKLTFRFSNGSSKVFTLSDRSVLYNNERWSLKSGNNRTNYQKKCVTYQFLNDGLSDYFYVYIRIPVVIQCSRDNTIDDLEFFYIGKSKDILSSNFPTKSYLGYDSNTCSDE